MLHKTRARLSDSFSHGCAVPAPSKRELFGWVLFRLGDKSRDVRPCERNFGILSTSAEVKTGSARGAARFFRPAHSMAER